MSPSPIPSFHQARTAIRGSLAALLALVSAGAMAAETGFAGTPTVTQLWVAHGLAAVTAGGLAFALGRNWALAGIVIVVAAGYAWPPVLDAATIAAGTQAHGSTYPFQATASALLIPLLAIGGLVARNAIKDLSQLGSSFLAGPERMLAQRVKRQLGE
ncbi:MAG: hypothetical protein MUC74_03825 [Ideonella sp.]|jgi:hypothetical protein|nr:hypothetical protein [Ideonella sp.]